MKYIQTFIFLSILISCARSQSINDKILTVFLKDTNLFKFVIPSFKKDCDTLYIVDTVHSFSDSVKLKFSKPVVLLHNFEKKPPFMKWYCYNLILCIKNIS